MQIISIQGSTTRFGKFFTIIQYISTYMMIFGAFEDILGIPDYIRSIFAINGYIFFLFFLGTSFLIFIKKSGQISFEFFMILEVCAGAFIQCAIGLILYFSAIPFYSEITEISIAGLNIFFLFTNQANKRHVSVILNDATKPLILIAIVFLVPRLIIINPGFFYMDDQYMTLMALEFTANVPNIYFQTYQHDIPLEIGFVIMMAIVMKPGYSSGSPLFSTIFAKIYLVSMTTFIIFPVYAFISRIIKDRKAQFIILSIMTFNQYIILESTYLLSGTLLMMFFTTAFYFFIRVLEKDGPVKENMIFCIIASGLTIAMKNNGTVMFALQILILCTYLFIPKLRTTTFHGKQLFPWASNITLPLFTGSTSMPAPKNSPGSSLFSNSRLRNAFRHPIFRIIVLQLIVFFIFSGIAQLDYYLRNGITMIDWYVRIVPYGFFGHGSASQYYTPVNSFSFAWLWERISINFPWYAAHFTQLLGFIHVLSSDDIVRSLLNYPVSIVCVAIFGVAMIYGWRKTARKNLISFFFQFSVFLVTFASIILWGEKSYYLYRFTFPFFIMIIPPVHEAFKAVVIRIKQSGRFNFNAEHVVSYLLLPFLAIAIYGMIIFYLVNFWGNSTLINAYGVWQFTGIMPQKGGFFSDETINILESMTQITGIMIETTGIIITGAVIGIAGIRIHKANPIQAT